jgi:hypothetical protein
MTSGEPHTYASAARLTGSFAVLVLVVVCAVAWRAGELEHAAITTTLLRAIARTRRDPLTAGNRRAIEGRDRAGLNAGREAEPSL